MFHALACTPSTNHMVRREGGGWNNQENSTRERERLERRREQRGECLRASKGSMTESEQTCEMDLSFHWILFHIT